MWWEWFKKHIVDVRIWHEWKEKSKWKFIFNEIFSWLVVSENEKEKTKRKTMKIFNSFKDFIVYLLSADRISRTHI